MSPLLEKSFQSLYPEYAETGVIDELRRREFPRLDQQKHIYLDYTGSGLYSDSQVKKHSEWLLSHVLGNPHSENPSSKPSTLAVESCRRHILRFFNADPCEYEVVFTANASHALKLVGESYPFQPGGRLLLTFDNHNSVNGIREFDRARGASTSYVPLTLPELRVSDEELERYLGEADPACDNLFAYPAQSNFSGVRHPLSWIEKAQQKGWDVLLDAAAFVPTGLLDLSKYHPDYVALSFYKMFGYPTGVGALVARKAALEKLHRPWFAGGTIRMASVKSDRFLPAECPAVFEDGTLDFSNIPAVEFGLKLLESISYETLSKRVKSLTGWTLTRLTELQHSNGQAAVCVYGPTNCENRGSTIALNFLDPEGRQVDHSEVESRANERKISVRTGCFCNPGAGELCLGISSEKMNECMDMSVRGDSCLDIRRCLDPRGIGAIRISYGIVSNFADARALLDLAESFVE